MSGISNTKPIKIKEVISFNEKIGVDVENFYIKIEGELPDNAYALTYDYRDGQQLLIKKRFKNNIEVQLVTFDSKDYIPEYRFEQEWFPIQPAGGEYDPI